MTKLRRIRLEHGWSVEGLARLSGVGVSSYYAIENGSRGVSRETAEKLADIFGVEPQELFDTKFYQAKEEEK